MSPFRVRRLRGDIPNLLIYLHPPMDGGTWGYGIKHFCVRISWRVLSKGLCSLHLSCFTEMGVVHLDLLSCIRPALGISD